MLGFAPTPARVELPVPGGGWALALDSEAGEFGGSGAAAAPAAMSGGTAALDRAPYQALVYLRDMPAG